jgi:AcrR family transcriptional regulator
MLDTAMRVMQAGIIPSVSDVAEAAQVSRATAYRYFPSQATMIQAVVNEALGPILRWTSDSPNAEERVRDLFVFAYPHIQAHEATHRAALLMALDQWTRRQVGTLGNEPHIVRGHRKGLLQAAVSPLNGRLSKSALDRLTQALSLVFGIESVVVLKDIWHLDRNESDRVAVWAAKALVGAALAEVTALREVRSRQSKKTKVRSKEVKR